MRISASRPLLVAVAAVALSLPATAAWAGGGYYRPIHVSDAERLTPRNSVQLEVSVKCSAPAGSTSYLSTTVWQGVANQPSYLEGQGQATVICDGARRSYSFPATTTVFFADKTFRLGKAMTESGLQYCVPVDPENTVCTGLGALVRQPITIHS